MGVVAKQSVQNIISIGGGVLLGALNTLLLYPVFLGSQRQGLVVALLSLSNLIQPFISVGLQHALIRFYPRYTSEKEKGLILTWSLVIPIVSALILSAAYITVGDLLLARLFGINPELNTYGYMIFGIAIATGLFEVFYSWLRVKLQSVFGNFLKEFYPRLLLCLGLLLFGFHWIDFSTFLHLILGSYYLRLLMIVSYGFWIHRPQLHLKKIPETREIIQYSFVILLAGTASSLLLDIDKSMLPALLSVENVAYYSVAIFMASVVELPGRAMFQIVSPLVAKALHEERRDEVKRLLEQSSWILLWGGGFIFLMISLNASDFYDWIQQPEYKVALQVVFWVGAAKLSSMALGCLNQIISNSEWYRYSLYFSLGSAFLAIVLNYYWIQQWGLVGAAYATFTVVLMINILKLALISNRMKLQPLSGIQFKIVLCILGVIVLLNSLPIWNSTPFWNIVGRSLLIGVVYVLLSYSLGLHKTLLPLLGSFFQRS